MEFNRLLKNRFGRKLGGIDNVPENMMEFLWAVNDSYEKYEKDRSILKQAMILELKEASITQEAIKLKAKSDFLSTMSHEIRTPLNAVVGITNLLLLDGKDPALIEDLNTLKFSSDLLLSLINNILDFNKIESGHIGFENVEFDIRNLINNLGKSFSAKINSSTIKLIIEIDPNLPQFLIGDSHRISQILLNLVGNAIKFTEKGFIKIKLKLKNTLDDKVTIEFNVEDTGIGISEDKHDLIFSSFSQAEKDTTRKYGGTGLGLSITKKILELMNSKIQLESELGIGSRFFFELTFDISKKVEGIKMTSNEITYFNNVKILLAEDNQINVLVAKRFLEKWGFEVDTAENGQIVLEKVKQHDYQLILMDLHMPVMDGYDASMAIRALGTEFSKLPIIALTASADSFSRTRVLDCGMDAIVTKPFEPKELNRTLEDYLIKNMIEST